MDYEPSPDRVLDNRKILDLFKKGLDDIETLIIYYRFEKNMTRREVSEILGINQNTIQTKAGIIRRNNSEYRDLMRDDNE